MRPRPDLEFIVLDPSRSKTCAGVEHVRHGALWLARQGLVARIGRPGGGHVAAGRWRGCRYLSLLGSPWLRVNAVAASVTIDSAATVAATAHAAAPIAVAAAPVAAVAAAPVAAVAAASLLPTERPRGRPAGTAASAVATSLAIATAAITITTCSTTALITITSLAFATAAITITTTALSLAGAFPAASLSSTVARAPSGGSSGTTARIHHASPVHAAADFARPARDRCLSDRGC